jgi:hypothetical protein
MDLRADIEDIVRGWACLQGKSPFVILIMHILLR